MSLVFYYSPQSSATPVHWTLEELGVPYEKVQIDIRSGKQKEADFLKINPNGKVPVIVHDGVSIFESVAIQLYLGETFGVDKGLFPKPGLERGEVMKWIAWCNVTLGEAMARVWRHATEYGPADERNPKAGESAKKEIAETLLPIVDNALMGKTYLVGDSFTLADLHLSSWLEYVAMVGIDMSAYKNIAPWLKRCQARPAHDRAG